MQELIAAFKNVENAVILPHCSPDGDAIGAALAMGALLEGLGKPYTICMEEPLPKKFAFLGGNFCLYTPSMAPPHTAVAVDCGDPGRLSDRVALFQNAAVRLNIDHHITNNGFGDINLVEPAASATSEIMVSLFEAANIKISPLAATCMLTGIFTDTGGFRFSNTTPHTHRVAAALMEAGADSTFLARQIFEQNPLCRMRLEAAVIDGVTITHDGKTAIGTVTRAMLCAAGAEEEDTEGLSSILRGIMGVETAALLRETADGIRLSLRTEESVDASSLTKALGGGGHARAAGATLSCSMEEAKERIERMIGEAYGRHC